MFRHKAKYDRLPLERKISRYLHFRQFADSLDVSDEALEWLELTEADFNHYRLGALTARPELSVCSRSGCCSIINTLSGVCRLHPCIVIGCTRPQRAYSMCTRHRNLYYRLKHNAKKE